ncbi:hypothetical protein D3C81_2118390 [compost metagenome]
MDVIKHDRSVFPNDAPPIKDHAGTNKGSQALLHTGIGNGDLAFTVNAQNHWATCYAVVE